MELAPMGVGFIVGLGMGALIARLFFSGGDRKQAAAVSEEVLELTRKLSALEAKQPQLEEVKAALQTERDRLALAAEKRHAEVAGLNASVALMTSEKKVLEEQLRTQREYLDEVRKQTRTEFENLANKILDSKSKTFSEQTEKNLETLLRPLKDKIVTFEKKVDDVYTNEAKERHALKSEIERLIGLNDRMTQETQSLTKALRGDSKFQGDWGELVLEKILEASGLREGHEYSLQKSHQNEEGDRFRPDVIINLPEGKHVVVDSKVSLTAYELHRRSEDGPSKTQALDAHLKSIDRHIQELAEKHYARLKGVNSPEFVFLFVPIEPAYLVAMEADTGLTSRAWKKGIALVTATTLLTSLKTVASIWRVENQNKNALEIATEGAKLYDKFVGFVEDFEKVGSVFETGQKHFASAMGKLKDGPGNVFRKMELLRELGAAPAKRIKSELLE